MDGQFSVVVGREPESDVVELADVQVLGSGLGLDEALALASAEDGLVVAPGAMPE